MMDGKGYGVTSSSSSSSSSSSENEDTEKTLPEVVEVPDDYRRWMDKFLTQWHTRMGFNVQNGADANTGDISQFQVCVIKRTNFKLIMILRDGI